MQSYQRFHASVIRTSRVSQTPPQTPPYFYQWVSHGKNGLGAIVYKWPTFAFTPESGYTLAFANRIAHKRLHGETGGVSNGGAISTLGAFCAVRKPCVAGCQNRVLCRFQALVRCAPEECREPAGQRCAHARRCSEASRPRWVALLHCCFLRCTSKLRGSLSLRRRAERKIC